MSEALKIDTKSFIKAVDRFGGRYGIGVYDVLKDVHRSWTNNLIKYTPPWKLNEGREAVNKDVNKIFISIDKQQVLDFYAANFGKAPKGISKNVRKKTKDLESQGVIFNWNGDKDRMRGLHEKYRTGRNRGVRFRSREVDVGPFIFGTGMYVPSSKLKSYIREKQQHVGKLKSGWISAAQKFGAKIDSYALRHSSFGHSAGYAADNFNKKTYSGSLISANKLPYSEKKKNEIADFATKLAHRDIKDFMKNRIDRIAKQWSASKNG